MDIREFKKIVNKGLSWSHDKKDWSDSFKNSRKMSNVDDGAVLAGEILHQLMISKLAMKKYAKNLSDLKTEYSNLKTKIKSNSENSTMDTPTLKNMISQEIGAIVPEIIKQIEVKLQKNTISSENIRADNKSLTDSRKNTP